MKQRTELLLFSVPIILVSIYLIGMGLLAMMEFIPLNLMKMGNPWGLLAILEGVSGILIVMVITLWIKMDNLERAIHG